MIQNNPVGGWAYPSEKYEFVSWDDEIPNWMESHKIPWFQTTNQKGIPVYPQKCYFNHLNEIMTTNELM